MGLKLVASASMDEPNSRRNDWILQLAARLRELRPSLEADEANEVAVVAFDTASDMDPEDAAEVFGDILNAKVPVQELRRWVVRAKKGSP